MDESMFIGLDVHARSVTAGVLDAATGEVRCGPAPARTTELVEWLRAQGGGGGLSVTYEAGPTGFGLARACEAACIPCLVAAPSRIPRAPGDRIKTDRRDALRLAKLLRLGELVAVRVPSAAEEAARDLVRAREDARGDLMRARHRLSKLLLRHDLLWEGSAWTVAHERWLCAQRFEERGLQVAYDEAVAAMQAVRARREALDAAIAIEAASQPWEAIVGRLACLRGVSTLTAFGLAAGSATGGASTGARSAPTWGLCPARALRGSTAARAPSPRPATATPGACWSRPPGISAIRGLSPAVSLYVVAPVSLPWCVRAPRPRADVCDDAGLPSTPAASAPQWPPWP